MSLLGTAGIGLGTVAAYMTALWLLSLVLRNASIADIFWGVGFVLLAVLYLLIGDGAEARQVLVSALVALWGLRLATHIGSRNWGEPEDYRYQRMREAAGGRFWLISYFQVFLLQGVLMWVISMPILAAEHYDSPGHPTVIDGIGTLVWAVGLFFEAVGDLQLVRFKANPANKGQVMRYGLWRYTRHPNYFGDATVWWGLFIIAAGTVDGLWTFFSPIAMTVLLLRVSGVALLERRQAKTKPAYAEYIQTTSAFIPMPSKRRA